MKFTAQIIAAASKVKIFQCASLTDSTRSRSNMWSKLKATLKCSSLDHKNYTAYNVKNRPPLPAHDRIFTGAFLWIVQVLFPSCKSFKRRYRSEAGPSLFRIKSTWYIENQGSNEDLNLLGLTICLGTSSAIFPRLPDEARRWQISVGFHSIHKKFRRYCQRTSAPRSSPAFPEEVNQKM